MQKTLIKHPWLLFFSVALGPFMICLDFLSIGIAIEPMAKTLSIDLPTLQWFLTAFAIGNSSFLVTAGFLSDRYSRKVVFISGIIIFVLSSAIIAASSSVWVITMARLFQGASGGLMVTTATALLIYLYEPKERAAWISGLVGAAGLGMVLGPILGGYIIDHYSWRWIFLINVPIGILDLILALKFIPKEIIQQTHQKLDWFGIILLMAILILLTVGLNQGHYWGWFDTKTLCAFISCFLLLILFVYFENKFPTPVFHFAFFKIENFFAANIAGFTIYFLFTAWVLIYGIYLQRVMGLSPQSAGFYFLPFGIALFVTSLLMKKITTHFNFKRIIITGYTLVTAAFLFLSFSSIYPSIEFLAIGFALFGIGFTLVNSNSIPAAMQFIPPAKMGLASGKCMMMRWLGGAVGAALISTIFIVCSTNHSSALALQHTDLAAASTVTLLHDYVIGILPIKNLPQSFSSTQLEIAKDIINHSYHYGLIISNIVFTLISLITLFISQTWIRLSHATPVKNEPPIAID